MNIGKIWAASVPTKYNELHMRLGNRISKLSIEFLKMQPEVTTTGKTKMSTMPQK